MAPRSTLQRAEQFIACNDSFMALDLIFINLFVLGLLAILAGSLYVWLQIFIQWDQIKEILTKFRDQHIPVPILPVALAIGWVGLNIAPHLLVLFSTQSAPTEFNPDSVKNAAQLQNLISLIVGATILAALLTGVRERSDLQVLGFRTDQQRSQLRDGFVGFLTSITPVFLVLLLTFPLRSEETTHPLLRLLDARGVGVEFVIIAVAAVVIAPLLEELIFRVLIQSVLVNILGVWPGIVLTAILFASVHGFPDMIALVPLALILGILYHWRRSYLSLVIMHALFNGFNLFMVLFLRYAENALKDNPWIQ